MPYRSVAYEFLGPAELMSWTRTLPPRIKGNVREISFFASGIICLPSRVTSNDSGPGSRQPATLIEACSLLQCLERVYLGTYKRLLDKGLIADVVALQEKLVKPDGGKVEVIMG